MGRNDYLTIMINTMYRIIKLLKYQQKKGQKQLKKNSQQ